MSLVFEMPIEDEHLLLSASVFVFFCLLSVEQIAFRADRVRFFFNYKLMFVRVFGAVVEERLLCRQSLLLFSLGGTKLVGL